MKQKILIVTIKFPFPTTGACESDRANGILQFLRLGFDVKVITKITKHQQRKEVKKVSEKLGIEMIPVTYKFDSKLSKIQKLRKYLLRLFTNPLMLDGAAFEFNDPELKGALKTQIENWKPNLVWFDYTYTWPACAVAKKYKTPIITRSLNFEPIHFLEENGRSFVNYVRSLPKFISEIMTVRKSDFIFTLSPKEARTYKKLGAKNVKVLPLRGLPRCLKKEREIKERQKLNVFYMGSSYNIGHMRRGLEFILKEIAPRINKIAPNRFCFHIFGGKFPEEYNSYLRENVVSRGFVEDLEKALEEMDIAFIPTFHSVGMMQKVFEPLSRGFPTITSLEGMGGYPFEDGKQVLFAQDAAGFIEQLIKLQDPNLRKSLSKATLELCNKLFCQEVMDEAVLSGIEKVKHIGKPG